MVKFSYKTNDVYVDCRNTENSTHMHRLGGVNEERPVSTTLLKHRIRQQFAVLLLFLVDITLLCAYIDSAGVCVSVCVRAHAQCRLTYSLTACTFILVLRTQLGKSYL